MKYIYEVEGQVNPKSSQSHIKYSFYIEEQHETVKILFEYYPKDLNDKDMSKELILETLEKYGYSMEESRKNWEDFVPLKNHVTLSIDDPDGFRGATHRHDYELELILSESEATPGLELRKNEPGMWDITLDIHALVTEKCSYRLRVVGE